MSAMSDKISPYSVPSPIDAMLERMSRLKITVSVDHFRIAEILACLQTLDEGLNEAAKRSRLRSCAYETWKELAGDVVSALPIRPARIGNAPNREPVDPFEVAKRDFPPSGNPREFRRNLPQVLEYMIKAARHTVGCNQRYTDNYHGVIGFQVMHHGLVTFEQCAALHRDVIHLPMPDACPKTGLVYRPDYSPDHLPRGCEAPEWVD